MPTLAPHCPREATRARSNSPQRPGGGGGSAARSRASGVRCWRRWCGGGRGADQSGAEQLRRKSRAACSFRTISVRVSSTLSVPLYELSTSPQPLSLLLPPPPLAPFLSSPYYNTAELSGAPSPPGCQPRSCNERAEVMRLRPRVLGLLRVKDEEVLPEAGGGG